MLTVTNFNCEKDIYQLLYSIYSEKFQAVVIGYTAHFIAGTSNGKIFLLAQTDFTIVEYLRWWKSQLITSYG